MRTIVVTILVMVTATSTEVASLVWMLGALKQRLAASLTVERAVAWSTCLLHEHLLLHLGEHLCLCFQHALHDVHLLWWWLLLLLLLLLTWHHSPGTVHAHRSYSNVHAGWIGKHGSSHRQAVRDTGCAVVRHSGLPTIAHSWAGWWCAGVRVDSLGTSCAANSMQHTLILCPVHSSVELSQDALSSATSPVGTISHSFGSCRSVAS